MKIVRCDRCSSVIADTSEKYDLDGNLVHISANAMEWAVNLCPTCLCKELLELSTHKQVETNYRCDKCGEYIVGYTKAYNHCFTYPISDMDIMLVSSSIDLCPKCLFKGIKKLSGVKCVNKSDIKHVNKVIKSDESCSVIGIVVGIMLMLIFASLLVSCCGVIYEGCKDISANQEK